MKKIITIAILFFSYLSFAQTKSVEIIPIEKSKNSTTVLSDDESTSMKSIVLQKEDADFVLKKKTNEANENPLSEMTLLLTNNFNWLHHSIVSLEKRKMEFLISNTLIS